MAEFKDLFKTADFKKEKHVPAIELSQPKKGENIKVTVSVGKEIAHPNTTEHHIDWISAYFLPAGETAVLELGKFEFSAHGASAQGPNMSTVFTASEASFSFKTDKPGTLYASSYCNIHGLWQSSAEVVL